MSEGELLPEGRFVLVVDDEPRVRDVIARMVASANHAVFGVATGSEALKLAADYPDRVSCFILDVHMPGMDGFEVLEELRRRSLSIPVVLSSGDAVPPESNEGAQVYFIKKPYLRAELLRVLERALAP